MSKWKERRADQFGRITLMAEAGGYCMVRRLGAVPFVMSAKDFRELPLERG